MGNRKPLKVLNGTKVILDDYGNSLDSFRINLESFRSFKGPLFHKPVTGQELFFAVSYSKLALIKNSMTNNVTNFLDNGYFRFKKHEISIFKVNLLDQKCVLRLIFFLNIKIEQNLLSLTWRVLPNNEKLYLVKMDLNFVSSAVICRYDYKKYLLLTIRPKTVWVSFTGSPLRTSSA